MNDYHALLALKAAGHHHPAAAPDDKVLTDELVYRAAATALRLLLANPDGDEYAQSAYAWVMEAKGRLERIKE